MACTIKKLNFVTWMIDMLKNRKLITIVDDQYGSPTLADNLAKIIYALLKSNKSGLYNVAGSDIINRYEFALKIAEVFNFDKNLIKRTTSEELNQKAPRPKMAGLKVDKIKKELGVAPLGVQAGLEKLRQQMIK